MPCFVLALLALALACQPKRQEGSLPVAGGPSLQAPTGSSQPQPGPPVAASSSALAPADEAEWTAGVVDEKSSRAGVATLVALRTASHAGYDRVVFEFEGAQGLPGYHVEYVDRPVRRCGSGDVTALEGDAWLAVSMTPARAHTDAGAATTAPRERFPKLPLVREVELTCDFEAEVSVVLGASRPNRYRVLELQSPTRLVIDVRH